MTADRPVDPVPGHPAHTQPETAPADTGPADTIAVPLAAFDQLVKVAAHVSLGKSAAFNQGPYPDSTARVALGALDNAGLMHGWRQRHPEPIDGTEPTP